VSAESDRRRVLEAKADQIIFSVTSRQTKHSDKADIITPYKADVIRTREVLVGTPDPSVREGIRYRGLGAPHLNGRSLRAQFAPTKPRPLSAWLEYQGTNLQPTGEGMGCTGYHDGIPANCTRRCASSRRP
jgi:hypothetical protein